MQRRLIALARHILQHADQPLPLDALGTRAGLSPAHLQRSFSALFGLSPRKFQQAARMGMLREALRTEPRILDAIFLAGFGSTSRVYERTEVLLGMTPSAYRAGGAGETLHVAVRSISLGSVLMAASSRGVCAVSLGDDPGALMHELHREFPGADLTEAPASAELLRWMEALELHLERRGPRPELPLDLRGTALQMSVWNFLMSTAEGEVLSYGALARAVGSPRAVRAVASACGANRVAVLVPCHRVLRGDGGLGGYRWGLERKQALLEGERGVRS
jgi:AraC family transcriptional regulator of adaptative response/methylated-DNA-[protein]-cysteine methyltransferase